MSSEKELIKRAEMMAKIVFPAIAERKKNSGGTKQKI